MAVALVRGIRVKGAVPFVALLLREACKTTKRYEVVQALVLASSEALRITDEDGQQNQSKLFLLWF